MTLRHLFGVHKIHLYGSIDHIAERTSSGAGKSAPGKGIAATRANTGRFSGLLEVSGRREEGPAWAGTGSAWAGP